MSGPDPALYRPNVGLALFNAAGLVLIAKRVGLEAPFAWQMPQGGIDADEDPAAAALRELQEEIGVSGDLVEILDETPDWLFYDFPDEVRGRLGRKGRDYRGQRQKWFALRFLGADEDIALDRHGEIEFESWRWIALAEAPPLIIPWKRPVYEEIARRFARYASPPSPRRGGGKT